MTSSIKFILALLTIITGITFSTSAQQASINPTLLSYNLNPGEISAQVLSITNTTDKKMVFELSLGDWLRDSIGNHQYFPAGTLKQSCASWVGLDNKVIELEPGESKNIRVTLKGPSDPEAFKEMKWAMLFVQNITEQTAAGKSKGKFSARIKENFRMGIHIYQTPNAANRIEAKALAFEELNIIPRQYSFTMANTGTIMLECTLRPELTNLATGQEIKLDPVEFPVFPGYQRTLKFSLPPNLAKGKYSLIAVLDYNEDMPLEAMELNIEIK